MSVRVIAWKPERLKGRFMVDIRFRRPDGSKVRDRQVTEQPTLAQARRWGDAREARLRSGALVVRNDVEPVAVPTLDHFFPRFVAHGEGEREKPSSTASKRSVYRVHLGPAFGTTPLNEITSEGVSALRTALVRKGRAAKTVNNVLSPLNSCLKLAVAWKVIATMPCAIEIKPVSDEKPDFYDFDDYARLCLGAAKVGTREQAVARLGGDAGLRRGEMMALRQTDVDFKRRQLRVEQAAWKRTRKEARLTGEPEWSIGKPKGGRGRVVPMTDALYEALQAHRHLRGEYVLCQEDGSMAPGHMLRDWLEAAQRQAGLPVMGSLHKLRHTFCSHLAMRSAPAKAIQDLAGHRDLKQTMRYMHLSPSALDAAIALLNPSRPGATAGATVGGSR